MSKTFDLILTVGSLVVGIMILIGKGDIFLKSGNAGQSKKVYDEEKLRKASGITLVLFGVATGVDSFTTGAVLKVAYIVFVVVVFAVLIWYLQTKCRK